MKRICNHLLTFFTHSSGIQTFLIALLGWLVGLMGRELLPVGCRAIPVGHFNFDPDMVEFFGGREAKDAINKAIIYQKFMAWIESNRQAGRNIRNGQAWSYNTYDQWAADIRIFHPKTIAKHVRFFETLGMLKSEQPNKRDGDCTKHYTSPLRLSDGLEQTLLWSEHETPRVGVKDSVDSSMNKQTIHNPSMPKAKTTTPTARGYEALNVGAVAQFSIPTRELPEGKGNAFEAAETHDEHERHAFEGTLGQSSKMPLPLVPPLPFPDDDQTEEETVSVDRTEDAPGELAELVKFFDGCTYGEVQGMEHEYSLDVLYAARDYALNERNHIDNPPGFVRSQLAKGWRPVIAHSASYVQGAFAAFVMS